MRSLTQSLSPWDNDLFGLIPTIPLPEFHPGSPVMVAMPPLYPVPHSPSARYPEKEYVELTSLLYGGLTPTPTLTPTFTHTALGITWGASQHCPCRQLSAMARAGLTVIESPSLKR